LQYQQLYDHYEDKWEIIRALHAPMSIDEEDERQEALAEVVDPMYMFLRADADADGEVDETAGMPLSESVDVTSEV
jgi:RNA polymerase II-associated factor 1